MQKNDIINVSGDASRASWLIRGEGAVLYDPGMAYSARRMIEQVKKELDGEPLDAVILSHSHYDHVGAVPFVRAQWPGVKVYGSAYCARVIEKPSVRETMRRLGDNAARGAGLPGLPDCGEAGLYVDVIVKEGDTIRVGSHKIQVYETPGHTRCSLSYLVDQDVLFCSETVGVFTAGGYMPCYLVGYQMSLDAVEKLRHVPAKRIFISHRGIQTGMEPDEIWDYLEASLRRSKEEILEMIRRYPAEEECLAAMKTAYHDGIVSESEQPSAAFLLNAAATRKVIRQECMQQLCLNGYRYMEEIE